MKRFVSAAATGFAIANLYLLFLTGPLVSPQHQLIFHLPGSATALFAPVLLDLLFVAVVLTGLLWFVGRVPRTELVLWGVLLLPVPWMLIRTIAGFAGRPPSPWLEWPAGVLAVSGILFCFVASRALMPAFRRVRRLIATILGFVALSGVVLLAQMVWFAWAERNVNDARPHDDPHTAQAKAGQPLVVWIILDELSYRQVYGKRSVGLDLPNFDRFAAQSTIFTDAISTARYTRIAVPALLTGDPLNDTSPEADARHLLVHQHGRHGWHMFDGHDTVFGDAKAAGLPTAVAGWYEPYCRLLAPVVDDCFWTYRDEMPGDLSPSASVLSNALQPARVVAREWMHAVGLRGSSSSEEELDVRRHGEDYRDLATAGDRLLERQRAGLLLLHMPIPHPWGFYDRRNGSFPAHRTSYLDNLVLADEYLGHVRGILDKSGSWDNTDVIVMGDHGWRSETVWRHSGFWTPEEEHASQGAAQEDGPAVIVKLHNQHTPARIDARFDAVRTRSLIDALLAHRIQSVEDLQRWTADGNTR